MADRLAKLADLKAHLGSSSTDHDTLLVQLLEIATAEAEQLAGRPLVRRADVTEYPVAIMHAPRRIRVARFPIESITSVKELGVLGTDEDFAAADALVENDDYVVDHAIGIIERAHACWAMWGRRHVQIVYTGGYVDPDESPMPDDAITPPMDLQFGILQQASQAWNHRASAGIEQVQLANGGSYRTQGLKPHPALVAACEKLRFSEL